MSFMHIKLIVLTILSSVLTVDEICASSIRTSSPEAADGTPESDHVPSAKRFRITPFFSLISLTPPQDTDPYWSSQRIGMAMQTRVALHVILYFDIKCAGLPSHQECVLTCTFVPTQYTRRPCRSQSAFYQSFVPASSKIKMLRLARQSAWVAQAGHAFGASLPRPALSQWKGKTTDCGAKRAISAPPIFCSNFTSVLNAWNGHTYILSVFIRSSSGPRCESG
jgi:hypothetical protein